MGLKFNKRILAPAVLLALMVAADPIEAFAYTQAQFDAVSSADEVQLERVRDQELTQIKIVLGRRFAESRRPDILLRLAELYVEKYRFYFLKENEIHQNELRAGRKSKRPDYSRSRRYLQSATSACLAILKSKVPFGKMDEVYYFLGYNAEELGRADEAARYFGMVARKHPDSPYAPEAYRNLAEHAFSKNKFRDAVSYYERAARFTKLPSYPRTLYKLAWAYFKVRRRTEALATMKRVVELAGAEEKFIGVREEALNDLVAFYADAGRPAAKEAHDYFESVSGGIEIYMRALKRLVTAYERRGEYRTALNVSNGLILEYGDQRPALVYEALGRNVELYRKLGDVEGEEKALTRVVEYLVRHGGAVVAKGEDSGEGDATVARTKNYLRGRATGIHKEAQKKGKKNLFSRAADLYALYLKGFLLKPRDEKEEKEAAEIRTYRSDALLAAGREDEALPELERALREEGNSKHRLAAGTTLLNILIKKVDAVRPKGAKALEEAEARFLSAAEAFESAFPNDKLVGELRYKRARLAAVKSGPEGLSKDARRSLSELIERYPSRPESAEAAGELVADALKRKADDEAIEMSKAFLANSALLRADAKGELASYIKSVIARQHFKDVQEIEKDNDHAKAAAEYERLAGAAGGDKEVAYKSLNNAAVNYEKAGRRDEAARVLILMMSRYKSNPAPRAELKRLAANDLWESRFAEAAKLYSKLSAYADYYAADERFSFARTAFSLEWGSGDLGSAFIVAARALREFCEPTRAQARRSEHEERCEDLAIDTARLMLDAKRHQEALGHLKAYLSKQRPGQRRAEASFMLGQLYRQQLHDDSKATAQYEQAARVAPRSGSKKATSVSVRERNFAARAAFSLVEPQFARFSAIKLELPEGTLKARTRAKLAALEGLVSRYSEVVGYGDGEWGIAALERLYDAFSSFATELETAPVPPGLDEIGKQQYQRGLQQVSQPMMARSLEYLKQGHQKGLQLEVTTPTFVALTQRLSRKLAREHPPAHYAMVSAKEESRESALHLSGPIALDPLETSARGEWRRKIAVELARSPKSADSWVEFGNLEALNGRLRLARLLYEQATALAPKSASAAANLAVIAFLEQRPIEASQGFARAVELAELHKDSRLNLAKCLLAFHHFGPALKHLRQLSERYPDDKEISEALAVALLGTGQVSQAGALLEQLDARGSNRFSLWYNWSVWAFLAGDADSVEDAVELLKDRRESSKDLSALERSQIDLALSLAPRK